MEWAGWCVPSPADYRSLGEHRELPQPETHFDIFLDHRQRNAILCLPSVMRKIDIFEYENDVVEMWLVKAGIS